MATVPRSELREDSLTQELVFVSAESRSSESESGWEYFPNVVTQPIRSKYVKQVFSIQIMEPARAMRDAPRVPVIYAADGNFVFDALKGISYSLQRAAANSPRFILVGIGYPGDNPEAGGILRARDLTFPGCPRWGSQPPLVRGMASAKRGTKDFFGADDFQNFIEAELIPSIEERYSTIPAERTFFGHSLGGSFGLFTLFSKTSLFKRYIVSSPALNYFRATVEARNGDNEFLLPYAERFIEETRHLDDTKLYLSVASEEEFEAVRAPFRFTSSFYRMAAVLKAARVPGLDLTTEVFSGENHMSVWPMAFIHGVRAIFGTKAERSDMRVAPEKAGT